jgi:YD repeat-containing protein
MIAHFSREQREAVVALFTFRRHHRYDEQSRRIETSTIMAPKDIDRKTFAYNDHGDVIAEISESSHSEYDFGDEGTLTPKPDSSRSHRSETQFRYQYDPHGNWIEKIAETPGGQIWSPERRTISYFE